MAVSHLSLSQTRSQEQLTWVQAPARDDAHVCTHACMLACMHECMHAYVSTKSCPKGDDVHASLTESMGRCHIYICIYVYLIDMY